MGFISVPPDAILGVLNAVFQRWPHPLTKVRGGQGSNWSVASPRALKNEQPTKAWTFQFEITISAKILALQLDIIPAEMLIF